MKEPPPIPSIVRVWIQHVKHVTLVLTLNHLRNTRPRTLIKQLFIVQTPVLEQIRLSHTNKHSATSQPPQIRILTRVYYRVVGSSRGWARKAPQFGYLGGFFSPLRLTLEQFLSPKIRMHQNNPFNLDPKQPFCTNPNAQIACDVGTGAVTGEEHFPEICMAVQPLVGAVSAHVGSDPFERSPRIFVANGNRVLRCPPVVDRDSDYISL
ncbi:hypothetical protein CR513_60619, partial [Mucuna pruriens]